MELRNTNKNILCLQFKDGKKLIVKLTRDVSSGEEIFNCYGPHYRRMGVGKRQEALRDQYFFECQCPKCREEIQTGTSFVVNLYLQSVTQLLKKLIV
jgi:hypothetical protein